MSQFEKRFADASDQQKARFKKIKQSLQNTELTDDEKRYLLWLCDFDTETFETFNNLFKKLNK